MASAEINPEKIMHTGMGFFPAKTLLTAVKFELFTKLSKRGKTGEELVSELGIQKGISAWDFFDSLVALGFLNREGSSREAVYTNTAETSAFLDKNKAHYIGGILEMANDRLYKFWGDLEEGLITGKPQNENKHNPDGNLFKALYESPERLRQFINAMSSIQTSNFIALAQKFDFSKYMTLCDIGGASGMLAIQVAKQNPHMNCTNFDLPEVNNIARETIGKFGLDSRVSTINGDFFTDDFPKADIISMGNILHDWNIEKKKMLIRKAYEALPEGGAFIAVETIIDDERRTNALGLLMSLNMLIELGDGFNFTGADFDQWAKEAGFKNTLVLPLAGPDSAAIAFK
jgi:precorrin-6B methylase 2